MIILTDIDDVLTPGDTFSEFNNEYFGTHTKLEDWKTYYLRDLIGISEEEELRRLEIYYQTPHFTDARRKEGAEEVIAQLSKEHDIFAATKRPLHTEETTRAYLAKYFPGIRDVFFAKKGEGKPEICRRLGAKLMMEDNLTQAIECYLAGIKVILFDYPWNQGTLPRDISRVKSWPEVLEIVR